jgi:hypothetical protein
MPRATTVADLEVPLPWNVKTLLMPGPPISPCEIVDS